MPGSSEIEDRPTSRPKGYFATTHWSVVLRTGDSDTGQAAAAIEKLCRTYWYPIYAYIRRRGRTPHDAEDLTQSFFAHLLQKELFANADPSKGKFRSFILGAMNRFLAKQWMKSQAQKRGAGLQLVPLDTTEGERRLNLSAAEDSTPDGRFDKEWATALLDRVLALLEEDYGREGKAELFARIKDTLAGTRHSQPYSFLATRLGMNEGAVRTAVHRLRKRYRQLLETEISNTVASPDQVKEEMAYLLRVIAEG